MSALFSCPTVTNGMAAALFRRGPDVFPDRPSVGAGGRPTQPWHAPGLPRGQGPRGAGAGCRPAAANAGRLDGSLALAAPMSASRNAPRLRGRQAECQALHRLVSETRAGHGQVLVLRGDSGVGKSALLHYVAD